MFGYIPKNIRKKKFKPKTAIYQYDTAATVRGKESDKTNTWHLEIVLWSARFVTLRDSGWQGR